MPTVDFTKDELKHELKFELREEMRSIVDERIDARITAEREYTRQLLLEAFTSFWESNLEPAFAKIERDLHRHNQLLAQHSQDIMELRARRA